MKTKLFALLALPLLFFASCSDNDDDGITPPEGMTSAFNEKFAGRNVTNPRWEMENKWNMQFYEANFQETIAGKRYAVEAYFTQAGIWQVTDIEIKPENIDDNLIPAAVKDAFLKSEYATWRIDDLDKFETATMGEFFYIEVEQGKLEHKMAYSPEGKLLDLSEIIGGGNGLVSQKTQDAFNKEFGESLDASFKPEWSPIQQNGRPYQVVKAKRMIAGTKVEFKAWYDNNGQLYMTETEFERNTDHPLISQTVKDAFNKVRNEKYPSANGWVVDDIKKLERANAKTLYVFEVENKALKQEVKLSFFEEGNLVGENIETERPGNNNNNNGGFLPGVLPEAIKADLTKRFPNYSFIEIDNEWKNGKQYYEVEIYHDMKKKEAFYDMKTQAWKFTKWEISLLQLPKAVSAALMVKYPLMKIDDVDQVLRADKAGDFYLVELESGKLEIKVLCSADGKSLEELKVELD